MNAKEIRDNCYLCGHRCLMLMNDATMNTDYCDHPESQMECSKIRYCDPSMRIPKKKQVRKKKAVQDV
jgi:hypothetical protein